MIEFIKEMAADWPVGTLCIGFVGFVFLCVGITAVWFVVLMVEPKDTENRSAVVMRHWHKNAYTTYIPIIVGKITVMSPQMHPEESGITLHYADTNEEEDISCCGEYTDGTEITVNGTWGMWTGYWTASTLTTH